MAASPEQERLVRRILRVNHAGEHGAIAIYAAQRKAGARYPEFIGWIDETLSHERRHREVFRAAMPERAAKPCRALIVWSAGGTVLGWMTARLGPTGLMVCTAAVERTVHRHLDEQIAYLKTRDPDLADIIRGIRVEEDAHLDFAEANHVTGTLFARGLSLVVSAATEALIWISTRGDSLYLRRALRAADAR